MGKRKPLMLSAGYFSKLYKDTSQKEEDEGGKKARKKKRMVLKEGGGDRFFRLSKQLMKEQREKQEMRDSEPKRKAERFARLARMFIHPTDLQNKQKDAEVRKWIHTPRLAKPLRKPIFPVQDVKTKKEGEASHPAQKQPKPKKFECESFFAFPGMTSNVWSMGQRISHWRLAHQRSYHIDSFTQDKDYKHKLIRHEQDIKTTIPLALQDLIEEEALIILMETLYDYQTKLGQYHPLAIELEEQVDKLHLQLQARGIVI